MDRALAMADQHEWPALIAMRQIVAPGGQHVGISGVEDRHRVLPAERRRDARHGGLAIDRCKGAADAREAGELGDRRGLLLDTRVHVAVEPRVARHRRIDVEAVDRRIGGRHGLAARAIARRIERHRRQRIGAGARLAREAQPARRIGIVDRSRRRRWRGLPRKDRGGGEGAEARSSFFYNPSHSRRTGRSAHPWLGRPRCVQPGPLSSGRAPSARSGRAG